MRVCLVTEELSFGKGSGGIGGAFHELAILLARSGQDTEILYLPARLDAKPGEDLIDHFADHGVRILTPELGVHAWDPAPYERRSYCVLRYLRAVDQPYDVIHFHDYKGIGYASLAAKQQRLAFPETTLVVQVHGPTRWALEANQHPFTHEDQIKLDFMERESIARADVLVSPSRYILDWLAEKGWRMPRPERVHVIQNACAHLRSLTQSRRRTPAGGRVGGFDEIVFFGRHEERKGLVPFCGALDLLADDLARTGATVTFLGRFGTINGEDSGVYLANRARNWHFPIRVLPDHDRVAAARHLMSNDRSLVVIPSRVENSPYTVLETIIAGKPLITSCEGGAPELMTSETARESTCEISHAALAARVGAALREGLPVPRLAVEPETTERQWLALHEAMAETRAAPAAVREQPKVVAAITHFERPAKLYEAMLSLAAQTYPNLEIVIVDDGSRSAVALAALERLEPLMNKMQIRLIRQENRYLGAARNRAVAETRSDFVVFLDDDDIAFPTLVQTLVTAAQATGADFVNCLNLYMPEARRGEAYPFPDGFKQKVSYVPLGGPLSMAPLENCFGAATALIRRSALERLGGYSEEYGVGHEDFELYARAVQAGFKLEVCPVPLYLYEVERPSMLLGTSRLRNWNRVVSTIDPALQAGQWHDLIALSAGRRAQEHSENSAAYRRRLHRETELLEQLARTGSGDQEYAPLVAKLAERNGADSFAHAMQALAHARGAPGQGEDDAAPKLLPLAQRSRPARARAVVAEDALLDAVIDLGFGRVTEAVAAFRRARERDGGPLTAGQLAFLKRLCRQPEADSPALRGVLGMLTRLPLTLAGFEQAAPVMYHLALRAGDPQTALGVVERSYVVDEELYLSSDAEAAASVAESAHTSGLDHYLKIGQHQGRGGFALLQELRAVLKAELGVEPPLPSFRQYMTSLAQAQQSGSGRVAPRGSAEVRQDGERRARAAARAGA